MDNNNITNQMKRLLYLIAEYTKVDDVYGSLAIKDLPLKALIYKGIITHVLDYDYAPISVMYMDNRRFLNISQEGEDDLDDLRDIGLINKVRLGTRSHTFIYAYLLSNNGIEYLKTIDDEDKNAVNTYLKCKCGKTYEIRVLIDGIFFICKDCGIKIDSEITDIEDVSYKSSPLKIDTKLTIK
ncbi:MAG: hypothetical protein ACTSPY_04730 [Candidatus Helarchaeota archaeon]